MSDDPETYINDLISRATAADDLREEIARLRSALADAKERYRHAHQERQAAEARFADATKFCSGEFPCEASTAAASLERQLHDAEAEILKRSAAYTEAQVAKTNLATAEARVRELEATLGEADAIHEGAMAMAASAEAARYSELEARCAQLEGERDDWERMWNRATEERDALAQQVELAALPPKG